MIVKNEEDFLLECLRSFEDVVDEIVIVDTGSTDKTLEIAERFNAKIYHFDWIDDFAAARNESLKYVTKDWVFIADADNQLDRDSIPTLKKAIERQDALAYSIDEHSSFEYNSLELGLFQIIYRKIFLFRNHFGIKFDGIVHEQVYKNILDILEEYPNYKLLDSNIKLFHYGYTPEGIERRIKRNTELTEKLLTPKDIPIEMEIYHKTSLAELKIKIGKYQEAKEILLYVIEKIKKHNCYGTFGTYLGLATIYKEENNYQEALKYLKEAINYFPDTPYSYYYTGLIYLRLNNYLKAMDCFNICIKFGEEKCFNKFIGFNLDILDVFAYLGLGFCYAKLGAIDDAKIYFEKCLELKPNFPQAKEALKIINRFLRI